MRMKMSEVKKRRKLKETKPVETKEGKKQTRIEYTLDEISKLSKLCKTEEQKFYGFTALDQCLKRLINICQQS